jgi:putative serine protease PepD
MTQTTRFPSEAAGAPEASAPRQQPAGPSFVYDPWAQPSESAAGTAPAQPAGTQSPGAQPFGAQPFGTQSFGAQAPAYPYAEDAYAAHPPVPPAPPQGPGRPRRGDSHRPGWLALGGATVSAAMLASLLTAGVITAIDDTPSLSTSSSTRSSAPSGPVTSSTAANPDWEAVAASASKSVVAIQVSTGQGGGQGSGVILDTKGHVVTNNHVVAAGDKITVVFSDGRGYAAKVVGTDPSTDLAVVKIENPPSGLQPIAVGSSDDVAVGDPVMAVGNPLGLSNTVTTGIVSALNRPVTTQGESSGDEGQGQDPFGLGQSQQSQAEPVVTNAIQSDVAVNPGNSGGALVDVQGRLIGINSSIASLGSSGGQAGSIGISFSIPVNLVKSVAQEIIATGKATHAWLGVQLGDNAVSVDGAQYRAAIVGEVVADSPAQKAELKANDAVIAIDGENVNGAESLTAQIRERKPSTEVTLTLVRDGKKIDVPVTLGTRAED